MTTTASNKKDLGQAAHETAGNVADKAKQAAGAVADKAKDAAGYVADKAKDLGQYAAKTADNAAASVGDGMKSVAQTIKQGGPQEGMLGKATETVASTVESAGKYLSEQGVTGAAEDLTNLIRRNPIPAILLGIGIGILIARATRS
jgi:hypothetical protein